MKSIRRYIPVAVATSVNIHGVGMRECNDGAWVSYAMHKQEIESLQARLKALESTQKHQISVPSWAIEELIKKLVREECKEFLIESPKYNGDPCHSTVDAFVSELAADPGKTVKDDNYSVADELTNGGKTFTFGTNFGEGKALTMSTAKMEPTESSSSGYGYVNRHIWAVSECESARDRKVAVCYHVNGNMFINGCEYEYEVDECETGPKPSVIHITQDAFLSGLKGDYRWDAVKFGKVNIDGKDLGDEYAIIHPDGGVVAQFYIK